MKKIKISPSMLTIIFIIMTLILSLNLYSNYIAQKKTVIELIEHSSIQLSKAIEKASKNTIVGYRLFIHQLTERMQSDLNYIHFLDTKNELTSELLVDYVNNKSFIDIFLLDKDGKLILSSGNENLPFLPKKELQTLLDGTRESKNFGINEAPIKDDKRLIVGIKRTNGGAIIGTRKASTILSVKRVFDLNIFLKSITADSTIKYIAIQDTNGIQYSTTSDTLTSILKDALLEKTLYEESYSWRSSTYKSQKILETIHFVNMITKDPSIIRIALDYSPIQKIQHDTLKQASIRLLILVFLGFLMIAYSVMLQNNQLLEKEKRKITEEITSLQANLLQKEKLSAIGELAAGVAHKIRNPLNAISMTIQRYSTEFEVKEDEEEFAKLNAIIKKEINQIGTIISQFLQFSRPHPICKTKTNLNKVIEKVIQLYAVTIDNKNIKINFREENNITAYVDEDKIKQSLINLLENAIDATKPGDKIEVILKQKHKQIIIIVQDTGCGIDSENIPKIFNLYFTTKEDGTGIGLAQVYQVISEHDGKILVDSGSEFGTIFTIIIPIKETL